MIPPRQIPGYIATVHAIHDSWVVKSSWYSLAGWLAGRQCPTVHITTSFKKHINDIKLSWLYSQVEWSEAADARRRHRCLHVGSSRHQQPHDIRVTVPDCQVQRSHRLALVYVRWTINFTPGVDKCSDDVGVATLWGQTQRGHLRRTVHVWIGVGLQKDWAEFTVAIPWRRVQCRPPRLHANHITERFSAYDTIQWLNVSLNENCKETGYIE